MVKFVLTLILATTAAHCQTIDGPYRRAPEPDLRVPGPRQQLGLTKDPRFQDRSYLQYDYVDSPIDYQESGNLQYVGSDEPSRSVAAPSPPPQQPPLARSKQRTVSRYKVRTSGGEIPGILNHHDAGYGRGYMRSCKIRTRAHELYCDVYVETSSCFEGKRFVKCPNGLVYTGNGRSGLMGVCDYPHRADCTGKDGLTDKELHDPPIATEHCDWLYGIFGHETSCTRYWTCWNGTSTEQFCIGGLLYNEETHSCDWPQSVNGCQKHPLCKDDANGKVPLGKSCNRYWACLGGYPRLQRCPAMLVFSREHRRCVSPPTSDCDVPTLPPPTEEEAENQQRDQSDRPTQRPANRRRFQADGGGGSRQVLPRRDNRPQQAPSIPLDFNLPDGALPLNFGGN